MKVKPIAEVVAFLQPYAEATGVEIVDAAWDMRTRSLTVFIDCEGGIDIDACERFHRAIDDPLDELDPTFGAPYTLNCSSPGLDRPFKTQADFDRHTGEKIELHFYAPYEEKKEWEGELLAFDGKTVRVATAAGEREFPFDKTSKVCLCIEV